MRILVSHSIAVTSFLGMLGISAGLMGYLARDTGAILRVALIAGGLLMIIPGSVTDIIGVAIVGAIFALQMIANKREKAQAAK